MQRLLLLLCASAACARPSPEDTRSMVPVPYQVTWGSQLVPHLPVINGFPDFEAALDFILEMEGSKGLDHPDDARLFQLAGDYRSGRRQLRLVHAKPRDMGFDQALLGYHCAGDEFYYTDLETSPRMLAVLVYHELRHVVTCDGLKAVHKDNPYELGRAIQLMIGPDVCRTEATAYAANVRFLIAMTEKKAWPPKASLNRVNGDMTVMSTAVDVWKALYERRFCELLKRRQNPP